MIVQSTPPEEDSTQDYGTTILFLCKEIATAVRNIEQHVATIGRLSTLEGSEMTGRLAAVNKAIQKVAAYVEE